MTIPPLLIFRGLKDISGFVAFDGGNPFYCFRIPGLGQSDRLGEDCRRDRIDLPPVARTPFRQAVQPLNLPAAGDAKPGDTGIGAQAFYFFLPGHQGNDIVYPLLNRHAGILKRVYLRWQHTGRHKEQSNKNDAPNRDRMTK